MVHSHRPEKFVFVVPAEETACGRSYWDQLFNRPDLRSAEVAAVSWGYPPPAGALVRRAWGRKCPHGSLF